MNSTDEHIGVRIKRAREKRGISIIDIGKHLNITPQAVHFWESGDTSPRGKRLRNLAKLLRVSVSWLQFGEGKEDDLPDLNGKEILDSKEMEEIYKESLKRALITCGKLGWISLKEGTPLDMIADIGVLELRKLDLDVQSILSGNDKESN